MLKQMEKNIHNITLDFFFLARLDKKKFQQTYDSLLREDSNPTAHLHH